MVSLNNKIRLLIDTLELHLMTAKQVPAMSKAMLRPACTTLRTLLLVTPEETIKKHAEKVHMMYEAIVDCSHTTEQEFMQHIDELLKTWN